MKYQRLTNNTCEYCRQPLVRVHRSEDNSIRCNSCNENLLRIAYDNEKMKDVKYVTCPNPKCRFYDETTANPRYGDKCPRCGTNLVNG